MTEHRMFLVDPEGCETEYVILQRPLVRDGVLFFVEVLEAAGRVRQWVVPLSQVRAAAWETSIEGGGA